MADWTIIKILSWTESYFKKQSGELSRSGFSKNGSAKETLQNHSPLVSVDSPRLTAEILLAHILKIDRLDLYLQFDRPLEKQELAEYKTCIKRRLVGEPVAYITGVKGFYESEFHVAPGVLIPRPDTETLVEAAIKELFIASDGESKKKVLELGAGSGAIVVSLAKAEPGHVYFANDISMDALSVAKKNSRSIVNDQICFFSGSWLSAVKSVPFFDLIVSNPPYIPSQTINTLQPEIQDFEPVTALDGGPDGLDCYRIIIDQAMGCLVPGGMLLLEIGYDQKPGLESVFKACPGYASIAFFKDLAGHDRVVKIIKKH